MLILLALLVCGVASLLGSRTLRYETAIRWATFTTFAGSLAAVILAGGLLQRFSARRSLRR